MNKGYIVLMSVLVAGAVGTAIALSLILLGVGSSRTSFALEQSNQAKGLANSCVEEALQQIRDSSPFTGSGNLAFGQGTCAYAVSSGGGSNRTIAASGTVGSVVRKISVSITSINPLIVLSIWQDVP